MIGPVSGAAVLKGLAKILGPALVVLVILGGTFYAGVRVGSAEQKVIGAELDSKTSKALLNQYQTWVAENVAAAKELEKINRRRDDYNSKTTQELSNALSETLSDRSDCRFPPDSMLILRDARDRATRAAAGGTQAAVP